MRFRRSVSCVLALAGLLLVGTVSGCSSSSSSGADTNDGAAPQLTGTYKAVTAGALAEITFFAPSRYALLRGPCDDQAAGCVETGDYAVSADASSLTLTPDGGAPASVLPYAALLSGDSASGDGTTTTTTQELRETAPDDLVTGTGAVLVCAPGDGPLVQAASIGNQQLVQTAITSPSSGWPGCSGSFDLHGSPTGSYYVTDFGCSGSPAYTDSGDNCCGAGIVAAASQGLCAAGTTTSGCTGSTGTSASIACERAVNWFSTGGSFYGRGTRLRLTNGSGKSVVVFVIDDGPACYRERQFGGYAIDVSYPTVKYLFGDHQGVSDRAEVHIDVVDASTPLGPSSGSGSTAPVSGSDAGSASGAPHPVCPPSASCTGDGDCNPGSNGSGLICTSHRCVAGCHSNGQCPGSSTCSAGKCTGAGSSGSSAAPPAAKSCTSDGSCNPGNDGAGLVCSGGSCTAGCKANWYCPGNQTCQNGQCG